MNEKARPGRVGELRPSQLLHSFGVGAVVDLPNLSVMVMGIDEWRVRPEDEIAEERLVAAVRAELGEQVAKLMAPPFLEDGATASPFDEGASVGVPVAAFPRWLRCPWCSLLAPVGSGLFTYKPEPYRTDRCRFVHTTCSKQKKPPAVVPARFLVACESGHLDDFPWIEYVHGGPTTCNAILRLREVGVIGATRDILVRCETCGIPPRNMAEAFGDEGLKNLPSCRGRRPHLRDREEQPCGQQARAILLGASNSWKQKKHSCIQFGVKKTRHWNAETGVMEMEARRHTDVWVFALLAHKDKATLDPLDMSQWQFYVVATADLDSRTRSQHSITLPSLRKLAKAVVTYEGLAEAVRQRAGRRKERDGTFAGVKPNGQAS